MNVIFGAFYPLVLYLDVGNFPTPTPTGVKVAETLNRMQANGATCSNYSQ